MAYVLGFFAADGYVTVNKRGGQFWCIQICDKELLETIKRVVKAEHTIGVRKASGNKSTTYRLQIGSIEMCSDLRKLGFGELKTKNLSVPHIPKKYFFSFVRGYFDGDGNVWTGDTHKNRAKKSSSLLTVFTSCSHNFLEELYKRLQGYDLEGGSLYRSRSEYSRLQYSTTDSLKLYKIMYNGGAFGSLYLQRKKAVFDAFIKMRM